MEVSVSICRCRSVCLSISLRLLLYLSLLSLFPPLSVEAFCSPRHLISLSGWLDQYSGREGGFFWTCCLSFSSPRSPSLTTIPFPHQPTHPSPKTEYRNNAKLHPPPRPEAFFEDEPEQTYQDFVDMGRRNPNSEGTGPPYTCCCAVC
jgi:hypothetical protein